MTTLQDHADRITTKITRKLSQQIYNSCAQEMEGLEHARAWLGNGHHAAQKMQVVIMKDLTPILETATRVMVLRRENPDEYEKLYGGVF